MHPKKIESYRYIDVPRLKAQAEEASPRSRQENNETNPRVSPPQTTHRQKKRQEEKCPAQDQKGKRLGKGAPKYKMASVCWMMLVSTTSARMAAASALISKHSRRPVCRLRFRSTVAAFVSSWSCRSHYHRAVPFRPFSRRFVPLFHALLLVVSHVESRGIRLAGVQTMVALPTACWDVLCLPQLQILTCRSPVVRSLA